MNVYMCMRVNHGDRLGGCEDAVENTDVFSTPHGVVTWLLGQTLIERDIRTDDDIYVIDDKPPMVNGSLDQDLALKMLERNGELRIVVFDSYEENFDSFAEIVVKRTYLKD